MGIIEIKNIDKSFGKNKVIDGLSLLVEKGDFFGIVGSSGCGKTTLLRLITGLEIPDKGEIFIKENCVFSKEKRVFVEPEKRNIGFVFQDLALWPHLNVKEHLNFVLEAKKIPKKEREIKINEILRIVQLEKINSFPQELSGGEKQRLAIARALIQGTEILLLDEAFSNLDQILRNDFKRDLLFLKERFNLTVICVDHNAGELFRIVNKIGVMEKGGIIEQGRPKELLQNPQSEFLRKIKLNGTKSCSMNN